MARLSGCGRRPVTLALLLFAVAGCGSTPSAPTELVVTLSAVTELVPARGSTQVTASVTDWAGSPAPDGIVVRFSTTIGLVQPADAVTRAGIAVVTFFAGETAGVADVRAVAAGSNSNPLRLSLGGAPVILSMSVDHLGDYNVLATADVQGAAAVRFEWFFERRELPEVVTSTNQARYVYATPGFKDVNVRVTLADGRQGLGSGAVVVE